MRLHGSNRPSIAAIGGIAALLVVNLAGAAFAARGGNPTGSNSQQGSAIWLVDYGERGCTGGSVNTSDNYITDDYPSGGYGSMHVWAKSTQDGEENPLPDRVVVVDKGNNVLYDDALTNGDPGVTCGTSFRLLEFYWANIVPGTYTVKTYVGDKVFASDSARFD